MSEQYHILLSKLDAFIRRFYKNQLIRGVILAVAALLVFFLAVNLSEYFGHFGTSLRTVLFYLYVAVSGYAVIWLIVLPLLRLNRIGKIINRQEAARIIGKHFPEVRDKLLNALQLSELQAGGETRGEMRMDLLEASIDQKARLLRPVPFNTAINLKKNARYLRYAVPPLLILLVILFTSPSMITGPTARLVRHQAFYEKPLPYSVELVNDRLEAVQHEDFRLEAKLTGDEVPGELLLETAGATVKLVKESTVRFYHTFINVQRDLRFRIKAGKYTSPEYVLKVVPKPVLLDFDVDLRYPAYTGRKNETLANTGDLMVPAGTRVTWKFYTRNTSNILMKFPDGAHSLSREASNTFVYSDNFLKNTGYSVLSSNEYMVNGDSLSYLVSVLPDLYPTILVEEYRDSLLEKRAFFNGEIRDDYGFDLLTFTYKVKSEGPGNGTNSSDTLPLGTSNQQPFYHQFDFNNTALGPGDEVEYYFEVWDNDRVNGSKSSRSQMMTFRLPTLGEIEQQTEKSNDNIKDDMEQAIRDVKKLEKEIGDLSKKMVDKKELNWEDKQQIQELLSKQEELQQKIRDISLENEQKSLNEQQYKEVNEEILNKQKELEDLFRELMQDPEIKRLFEELQKLLEKADKNKVSEMLEKMKMTSEDLEKQLDRNLELFKQLEFEKKLEETINKLDELAAKQDKLADESLKKDSDTKDLQEKQDKLNKEFDEVRKDIEALDKLNRELEDPNKFDREQELQQGIMDEMQNSSNSLQKSQKGKASKSQKNASSQMSELAQSLFDQQQDMLEQGAEEDSESLRQILDNLVQLSFEQEELMSRVRSANVSDPQYVEMIEEQKNIHDDIKMVEDSLNALAKRQIMIKSFISKELSQIDQNLEKARDFLNNRRTDMASDRQHLVMTSINNLALMLSETLDQMMQSMMQQKSGKGVCKSNCKKPGGGNPSGKIKSIRQLQDQLNKQIEQMKNGQSKGGKLSQGNKQMSEQLARMAAQQEAIRNQLQEYADQLQKEGTGNARELNQMMKDMERTETDLVNKVISQETMMRQKEILTRLLNSEKAEMEREKEERRESREAQNYDLSNPAEIFKYNRSKFNETELLKTVPPRLNQFYKNKVTEYFYQIEK